MDTGATVTLMSQDVWKKVACGWILVRIVGIPLDASGTARVSLLIILLPVPSFSRLEWIDSRCYPRTGFLVG